MQGVWVGMTYAASRGPKLILGSIGVVLVGVFFWTTFSGSIHEFHQKYQIETCEKIHDVSGADMQFQFGLFHRFGWRVTGDSPQKRDFIDCVRSRLEVHTDLANMGPVPAMAIWQHDFREGLTVVYRPAQQ